VIGAMDLPLYHQEQAKFDMFISGAKPEYDYISEHFNYKNGEVRYTGLARFDALHDFSSKRQILIMPTWRRYVFKSENQAEKSEYIECWNHLLSNPRLVDILEKYNVNLYFCPHHKMLKKGQLFSASNSRVVMCDFANYDVQTLLKESALLITDYSSVNFDFAYMNKPVIYYQFDEEDAFLLHHPKGYFDFQKMGFGEKVKTEAEVLNLIEEYISTEFRAKPEYEKRIEGFFPLHDNRNCERIYQEIVNTFDHTKR
jgi:CDP-glycerol glycerophosphotransferase (TagB/SpsB family)